MGSSLAMRLVRARIERFAATDFSIVVVGATGTGKEIVARQIHAYSSRRAGPFVEVNCGAVVETLGEAEFFGIEQGTASGVRGRTGLFERAHGGSLFLDEFPDLTHAMQTKLLRVTQDLRVQRVGGESLRRIDTRLIVASHYPLRELVARRILREDLYHRLFGLEIVIPPLAGRGGDILELADHFLAIHGGGRPWRLTPAVRRALTVFSWPGNVRQLERTIQVAITLATSDEIGIDALPNELTGQAPVHPVLVPASPLARRDAAASEAEQMLRECGGNKAKAARRLGISRPTLYARLRHLAPQTRTSRRIA